MAKGDVTERIVTRPDGTSYKIYQGEYRDRDGKRKFVSDKNKHKAQAKLRTAMDEVHTGTHAKGGPTLGEVIDEYLYGCEKAARRGDFTNAHKFSEQSGLKWVPDSLKRKRITSFRHTGDIQAAVDTLLNGYAARTKRNYVSALSRVFSFAMQPVQGYVPRNVMRDFPIKTGRPEKRDNVATFEEVGRLLDALPRRKGTLLASVNLGGIIAFMAYAGVRTEEACGLQITDIKRFDRPPPDRPDIWAEATIQHTHTRLDGFQRRTKNKEVRVVGLVREVVDAFDRVERYWQADRWVRRPGYKSYKKTAVTQRLCHYFKTSKAPPERRQHGGMFLGQFGTLYNSVTLAVCVQRLALDAGIVRRDSEGRVLIGKDGKPIPRISLYSLRHMVATHNAAHLPTHIAAAVTGHTDQTFLGTYVHRSRGDEVRAAASLGKLEKEIQNRRETEQPATNLKQRLLSG